MTNWIKCYYKLGQLHFITNWGSFFITNWGKCYCKLEQLNYYKSGQLLQIRATVITNWGNYYKLGHNSAIQNYLVYMLLIIWP